MRATKATLRKQGDQCAWESAENTTRIAIRSFRTHKPRAVGEKAHQSGLSGPLFRWGNVDCWHLHRSSQKLSTYGLTLKRQRGLGHEKWIQWRLLNDCDDRSLMQGFVVASRSKWSQNSVSLKILQVHTCSYIFWPRYIKFFFLSNDNRYNAHFARRGKCCINPCHTPKRINWGRFSTVVLSYLHVEGDSRWN